MKWNAKIKLQEIYKWHGNTFRAVGKIYGDDKKRFDDGIVVHTSRLEQIDFLNGYIITKNTTYKIITEETN